MYFKTFLFVVLLNISLFTSRTITVSTNGLGLADAMYQTNPGDVIEIKGGVYTTRQNFWGWKNGTESQPITVRPAPGETVIFDGSSVSYDEEVAFVSFYRVSNFIIEGPIEIRNSAQGGFQVIESINVKVSGLHIHNVKKWGLLVSGENIVVENNHVHDCVMSNENSTADYGWSQCVMTWAWDYNRGNMSKNVTWQKNYIHDAWGEGIDIILCDGCTARENNITNTFSVILYVDNSRNVVIENNVLRQTTEKYNNNKGFRPAGIALGNENWMSHPIPIKHVTIKNNLVIGSRIGVGYWGWSNYYSNIKIYHNTFWNIIGAALYIDSPSQQGKNKDCEARNNFFYITDKYWAGTIGNNEKAGWTLGSNFWYGVSWLPLSDTGSTTSKAKNKREVRPDQLFYADPNYNCENDQYWNNKNIAKECFRPSVNPVSSFNLKNSGTKIVKDSVTKDFYGCDRNQNAPSVGLGESTSMCSAQ